MGRYDNDTEKELRDGRKVFRSKLNPNVPLRDDDIYVVTQTGDRLDTIAQNTIMIRQDGGFLASK